MREELCIDSQTPNEHALGAFLEEWFAETPSILAQTSGSTGTPKAIELPKIALAESAQRTLDLLCVPKKSIALLTLPLTTIAGKMMVIRALSGGLDIRFGPGSLTPGTSKWPNTQIELAAMVPAQVESMVPNNQWNALQNMHALLIGGAPLSPGLESRLRKTPCLTAPARL